MAYIITVFGNIARGLFLFSVICDFAQSGGPDLCVICTLSFKSFAPKKE